MRIGCRWILCARLLLSSGSVALDATIGVTVTPFARETDSWDSKAIVYPEGKGEMTALFVELAPGAQTGWHSHPTPSFANVLEGSLEVTLDDGRVKCLKRGDVLAEVVNRSHNGRNAGDVPVKLVVFYTGAVGTPLTLRDQDCAPAPAAQ
jgi:quercetin dioxygenase-like cupin family protein